MTTSDEQRGPSRATVVALVIVASALALLPALRGNGTVQADEAVVADCAASPDQECRD